MYLKSMKKIMERCSGRTLVGHNFHGIFLSRALVTRTIFPQCHDQNLHLLDWYVGINQRMIVMNVVSVGVETVFRVKKSRNSEFA